MALPAPVIWTAFSIAKRYLPQLTGRLFGEKGEATAEKVVDLATGLLGLPKSAGTEEIMERLAGDSLAAEQLQLSLAQIEYEEYKAEIEDRASARRSQEARGSARGNWMLGGVTLGLLACLVAVATGRITETGALALITTIAGALLKMLSDAFAFEFGSSRGSKEKDAQITEFKQAMLQFGSESIRRTAETAEKAVSRAPVVMAPAAAAPEAAPERPTSRDFVDELRQRLT
ncbi:hypothetical protein [Mangrovicoccus algicola]|uniref:Uncharacterized protein n=1 Tax=Mangrovicoccus algicola TaxID=2771008 RepID=A0A8J6YV22_9RHOB|nr:hypothetical protein [Mangrovicoccus algicola]MBE3636679.1 hypothetical protein [Mangrovicoccus algicola]